MVQNFSPSTQLVSSPHSTTQDDTVIVGGKTLTIDEVVRVARYGAKVCLTSDEEIRRRVAASHDYIVRAAEAGKPIYGVTMRVSAASVSSISDSVL